MSWIPRPTALATAALCLLSTGVYAGNALQVEDPYVRAVPPGQTNSAAFMTLTNASDADHALVAAESSASKVVELHTHKMEGGMMKMRRLDKIELPAGETVKLQPGGLHVMLIGLARQLSPGDNVEITLVLDDGSRTSVAAPVKTVQQTMEHHQGSAAEH